MTNDDTDPGNRVAAQIKELRKNGRAGEAIELGERFRRDHGLSPRVLCSLGSAYLNVRRYDEAKACFDEVLQKNPNDAVAWNSLGQLADRQGRVDDAKHCFEKACEVAPSSPEKEVALNMMARMIFKRGRPGKQTRHEAETAYKRTLDINPANEVALVAIGYLALMDGRRVRAENFFQQAVDANPKNEVALTSLGQAAEENGKPEEARRHYGAALTVDAQNPIPRLLLTRLELRHGNLPEAIGHMRTQLIKSKRVDMPSIYLLKIMIEHGIGDAPLVELYKWAVTAADQLKMLTEAQKTGLDNVRYDPAKKAEALSPDAWEEIDNLIGNVSRSRIFSTAYFTQPINRDAARVAPGRNS